jgi:hypothetical protein
VGENPLSFFIFLRKNRQFQGIRQLYNALRMKGNILRTSALWGMGLILALLSVSLVALFTRFACTQVRFAKTYGGTSDDFARFVQQTSDGGYIVVGETNSFGEFELDIFLIKTDAKGNIQWAKTYEVMDFDYASSVQQTSDGGYIVAGYTTSFRAADLDIFLIKTDANGNIIWAKTYGGTDYDYVYSVQHTFDGGYIVAGITGSFGAGWGDIFLIKIDPFGGIQWAKTYGGISDDGAFSVQQTYDGGYIVAGYTRSFGAISEDVFLIKIDPFGDIQWAKTYGGKGSEVATSVRQTADGGYIVAGYTTSFGAGKGDIFLIKTDANGNIIWAKTYGGEFDDKASSVQQTSDGGYIVAGHIGVLFDAYMDILLIKTDAKGNIQWAKTYGEADTIDREAYSVQQTSDGGYILAGTTISFGAGERDIFLIKTDAKGNIGSCSIVQDASLIVNNAPFAVTSRSPSVSSPRFTVNSVSPTVTSPNPTVSAPCP